MCNLVQIEFTQILGPFLNKKKCPTHNTLMAFSVKKSFNMKIPILSWQIFAVFVDCGDGVGLGKSAGRRFTM